MKRLTMRSWGGVAFWADKRWGGGRRADKNPEDCERLDRLAAYEDTGLGPEEVSEYQHLCDSYVEAGLDAEFVQFCIDAMKNGLSMDRIRELAQAEKDGRLVVLPPNDPLTLEGLREMDGEPVWVEVFVTGLKSHWGIVHGNYISDGRLPNEKGKCLLAFNDTGGYDIAWLAYRRKPEDAKP